MEQLFRCTLTIPGEQPDVIENCTAGDVRRLKREARRDAPEGIMTVEPMPTSSTSS